MENNFIFDDDEDLFEEYTDDPDEDDEFEEELIDCPDYFDDELDEGYSEMEVWWC